MVFLGPLVHARIEWVLPARLDPILARWPHGTSSLLGFKRRLPVHRLNAADTPQGFHKESTQGLFVSMLSDGLQALKRIQRRRRTPCDLCGCARETQCTPAAHLRLIRPT